MSFATFSARAFVLTLAGLAVGIAASFFLTRFLRGLLFGVGSADWLTFATVAIVLCVAAMGRLLCSCAPRRFRRSHAGSKN